MSHEFDNQAYGALFLSKEDNEDGYRVKPEVMDIVLEHFPEGELVLSMDNTRAKVLICAADIQFYLENNSDGIDRSSPIHISLLCGIYYKSGWLSG